MSHKIRPENYRLGYLFDWKNDWYTHNINYSNFLIKNLKISEYLNRILYKNFLFLGDLTLKSNALKVLISLTCYPCKDSYKNTNWDLINHLCQLYFQKSVQINYYYRHTLLEHPNFITNWLCFLLEKEYDLKIILNQVKNFIKKTQENEHQINKKTQNFIRSKNFETTKKLIETKNFQANTSYRSSNSLHSSTRSETYSGNYYCSHCINSYDRFFSTKVVLLRGLKIIIRGRLHGLQNQISTVESIEIGTVPLQTKEHEILYSTRDFVTKYGVYGIQVWIFYN
jgi:hypothetical protein